MPGLFWTFTGTGGQAGLQLLVLIVLARLVSPEEFGLVAAALFVAGFSAIFAQCGIGPAVVQRLELQTDHLRTGFTISVFLGALLAVVNWVAAPAVAALFHLDGLTPVLRALSLLFLVQGFAVVAESLLQRDLRFRSLACVELATVGLGYGAVGIGLALAGLGVWALVGANLAQTVLRTIALLAIQPHAMRPQLDRKVLAELMHFGGGFTAARLANYLAGQGDSFVVARWLGAAALGVYGRACQLMVGPAMLLGEALDRALFPAMAKVQDRPTVLAETYRRGVALIALVVLPASTVLVVLAPEVIHVLLGSDWAEVTVPLQILALGMLFRTSYKMSDSLVRATGAVYRRAWRQVAFAVLVVTGAWLGQPWKLPGVAVGVVAAVAVNFGLMAHLSLCLVPLPWRRFWAAHLPGLALAGLVGVQVYWVSLVLRAWTLPATAVLLVSVAAIVPSLLVVWCLPRLFPGQDGRWMFRTLADQRTL